jgi:hypothetical protein
MISTTMIIAASILLAAVGLVAWAWLTMDRVEEDLLSLSRLEGMHFEIGPQAAEVGEGAR